MVSNYSVSPFDTIRWQRVMAIKCCFISSRATTKVQNRIKRRREMLPLLMLWPFENQLAMRRATMLQGRIIEQRDGGIWNEVWEPPSISFILTSKPLKCFPMLAGFSIFYDRRVFGAGWARAEGNSGHGSFEQWEQREGHSFIKRKKCIKAVRGSKSKVDKWLITSRNEMIHHFLKLSSLKDCLWKYISVS